MARRRGFVATVMHAQREAERAQASRARRAAQAERDTRRAANAAARTRAATDREWARDYAASRTAEAADETREIEAVVERLASILAATLDVDDYLDLDTLKPPLRLPHFDPTPAGHLPPPPQLEAFLPVEPTGARRLFVSAGRHQQQSERAHEQFQQALASHETHSRRHADAVHDLKRTHDAECTRLTAEHATREEEVTLLQRGLAAGSPEAVVAYLDLVLERADYPEDFPHRWRLAFTPEQGLLAIDYELPTAGVVPAAKSLRYTKSSDTITALPRSASQTKSLYASVIHQVALRVAHEVLEADRRKVVKELVFNGHVSDNDAATGRQVRRCLVAFRASRTSFDNLDLAHVDATACLGHLDARLSRNPIALTPVEPVVASSTMDLRFVADTDDSPAPESRPEVVQPTVACEPAPASPPRTPRASTANSLSPGQNIAIMGPIVDISLVGVAEYDLSALLVGDDGRVARDGDFIFFNNPSSLDGSVVLRGGENPDGATVDLSGVPSTCHRLVFVASSSTAGGTVGSPTLQVLDLGGPSEGVEFAPKECTGLATVVCLEVYRRSGAWKLRAVGQGYADGLAGLARDYGVNVE